MSKNSKPDTNIAQISNQAILVTYNGTKDEVFILNCPFVPDEIQTRISIAGIADPVLSNLYTLETNLFPSSTLPYCNESNTLNPLLIYFNSERKSINSSFTSRVRKHDNSLYAGSTIIAFTFIRYADK